MKGTELVRLPQEQEELVAIMVAMIDKQLLATREKLGFPAVQKLDEGYWCNFDIQFRWLCDEIGLMERLANFISQYWLPEEIGRAFVPLSLLDAFTYTRDVLEQMATSLGAVWCEDGEVAVIGVVTPEAAQFVKEHRTQLKRVIALVGPSLSYVCAKWGLEPEQYRALVSRDTLEILAPDVRWRIIY